MARTHLFEYGPSRGTGAPASIPRITTSVVRLRTRGGTIVVRKPVALSHTYTNKSVLRNKVVKGIRQPGLFTPNYPSPLD